MSDTPCSLGNPDDWFITQVGKQYPSDPLLTNEEEARVAKAVLVRDGETDEEHAARVHSALMAARGDRRRANLGRRRRAKEACFSCPIMTACLEQAIEQGAPHGTWGGYYEEEIEQIRRRRTRRREL